MAVAVKGDGSGDDGEDVGDGEHVGADGEVKAKPEGLVANHEFANVLFFFGEESGAEDEGADDGDEVEPAGEGEGAESDVDGDVDGDDVNWYGFVFALEQVVDEHF